MWYRQLLVFPLIAGLVWVLAGAWAQQTPPAAKSPAPPQTPPTPPPPKADPEAVKSLNLALDRFGPKREGWLRTTVWQQVNLQGLTYQADGLYLSGPGHRLRLDLKVRVGGTEGELQVVCDGTTLWQSLRVGSDKPVVSKFTMAEVLATLNRPDMVPEVRNEFLRGQAFLGVAPLLESLKQLLVFTHQETGDWQGHKVHLLTGTWLAEHARNLGTAEQWPPGMARKCVLYLDAQTSWPSRLEWWGPAMPRAADQLLMQLEFRDPKMLKPDEQPPAEYVSLCKFEERDGQVTNQTKQVTDWLRERNKQLTPKTPPAKK